MRVLILSAILAFATAAPSGDVKVEPVAVLPVATPTIDPGDLQAAAINAQVAAEDQARAALDKIVEENNEKVVESDSLVKEKTEEAFWQGQEKQWQALEAVHQAEAKLDGAVASSAEAIARSALGGVVLPTYVVPSIPRIVPGAPLVAGSPIIPLPSAPIIAPVGPLTPILYTPGLVANKEEEKAIVKTAEPEKDRLQKDDAKERELVKNGEPEKDKVKLENVYPIPHARIINPVFVDRFVFEKAEKERQSLIAKIAEYEKEKLKAVEALQNYPVYTRIISPVIYSVNPNEIEQSKVKKEGNKLEKEKNGEPLGKDGKPVLAQLPLVLPQPWPLSPVAPVYIPQPLAASVIKTEWK